MHNFKELKVWQKSRELVSEIYTLSRSFPKDEQFGLISQMRRAAVSIPTNIAEGSGKGTDTDFCRFLDIAYGSSCELETQLILSFDQEYIIEELLVENTEKIQEIQRMIYHLKKHLMDKT